MPLLGTRHQRAAVLILCLGAALLISLLPFATGLLGIPVLYVIFAPVYKWLVAHRAHPRLAASVVVVLVVLLIVIPGVTFGGLVAGEAQDIARHLVDSPVLSQLGVLHWGSVDVGGAVARVGERAADWLANSVLALIGAVTKLTLNLVIALFGLYYLLQHPREAWAALAPYIPFSPESTARLLDRFHSITISTVIGVGAVAAVQGTLVGGAFWATGLSQGVFWGVVTAVLSILPVVGGGFVWGPGAVALWAGGHPGSAVLMLLWGVVVVGNVDYFVRPLIYQRWADVHPLLALVGAFAGVPAFGILGLLIGPLALCYFFELLRMYEQEYMPAGAG